MAGKTSRHTTAWLDRATTRAPSLAAIAALALLAGCTGDTSGDKAVQAAEAQVASSRKALDEVKAAASAVSGQFCSSSATYITAMDRYADVLSKATTTVGDVKAAGRALEQPGQDAAAAADAAVGAHKSVTRAEQDLAAAQGRLAAVKAWAAGGAAPTTLSTAPPIPTRTARGASVARVQQAQTELAAAQLAVTDNTTLRAAGWQFNAAAVSLQMAWLQLLAAAGCLSDPHQNQAATAVHDYAAALQHDLAAAGLSTDTDDGVYGPTIVAALGALQPADGLPFTGAVDKATEAALRSDMAVRANGDKVTVTEAVQKALKLAGYWHGPVGGQWTDALTEGVASLQKDSGVPATGKIDAATVTALERAIAQAK